MSGRRVLITGGASEQPRRTGSRRTGCKIAVLDREIGGVTNAQVVARRDVTDPAGL